MPNWSKSTKIVMIVILCTFATLLAVLIGTLPQIVKPVPAPTTFIPIITVITLPPQSLTATFTPLLPIEMPKSSLASTETLALTTTLASEIRDTQGVKMRLVSAGEFTMGSNAADALIECRKYAQDCQRDWFFPEEPPHPINLSAFYMDVYEVTNAYYQACVIAGACTAPHETLSYTRSSYSGDDLYDNYPVIFVDWNQAKTYCEWRGARLPSEAEWEKAARGVDGRTYPWGEEIDCANANYKGCVGDTSKVGRGKGTYGIYDLAGNVWEWVADWYQADYYTVVGNNVTNPLGPASGDGRVIRGGAWINSSKSDRSTLRNSSDPAMVYSYVGFRCARDVQP